MGLRIADRKVTYSVQASRSKPPTSGVRSAWLGGLWVRHRTGRCVPQFVSPCPGLSVVGGCTVPRGGTTERSEVGGLLVISAVVSVLACGLAACLYVVSPHTGWWSHPILVGGSAPSLGVVPLPPRSPPLFIFKRRLVKTVTSILKYNFAGIPRSASSHTPVFLSSFLAASCSQRVSMVSSYHSSCFFQNQPSGSFVLLLQ